MSKTAQDVGMIAGGIAAAVLAWYNPGISIAIFQSMSVSSGMLAQVGVSVALAGTAGLLNPAPNDPSNIGPQGQLPVRTPNPLWRVIYGIFQFAGAITFEDGPMLGWAGTGANQACLHQFVQRIHTLSCHQIAGFLAVVIDGQTYNFGTDLVLLTAQNNIDPRIGYLGPPGMWGFINSSNPWLTSIFFAFDCGDPGNTSQPFPYLLESAVLNTGGLSWIVGSQRWTPACLQRGRAKVHVLIHYNSQAALIQNYGVFAGPQPYMLDSGRLPSVQFKVAGRIIKDCRVVTAWQPSASYPQYSYVLANVGVAQCVFVQQNASGISAGVAPNFGNVGTGQTVADGTCLWKNAGVPIYAAGSGATLLNNPAANKLGGPGGSILIADAWQGGVGGPITVGAVIEAPIGWLQQITAVSGASGINRPNFATVLGGTAVDGGMTWVCLGRSIYATCLPDNDGTQNNGGFSNPALVIADYLQTTRDQFGLGAALTLDSIDSVIAAANICDEPVVIEVF